MDYLQLTPFDRTLYLDSDTMICTPIDDVFDLLDRFDIALAHAHSRNRKRTLKRWTQDLPRSFPQFNGGVIAYRSRPQVLELLDEWRQCFHSEGFKKDQVRLRELLWKSDLRITMLPRSTTSAIRSTS